MDNLFSTYVHCTDGEGNWFLPHSQHLPNMSEHTRDKSWWMVPWAACVTLPLVLFFFVPRSNVPFPFPLPAGSNPGQQQTERRRAPRIPPRNCQQTRVRSGVAEHGYKSGEDAVQDASNGLRALSIPHGVGSTPPFSPTGLAWQVGKLSQQSSSSFFFEP